MFGNAEKLLIDYMDKVGEMDKEFDELKNRIDRVCEFIEDNLINQQTPTEFLDKQLRNVISILKGESH